jgi:hypothetical protein
MTRKLWLGIVPFFLLAVHPGAAHAGRLENMEKAAKKACLTGDANRGVSILADLFIDTDDPTYIFNQGRCFEQNNRYDDAINKFREYLRKAAKAGTVSAQEKADAEKHIADCQALLGTKTDGAATTATTPEPTKPVLPTPEPKPREPEPVVPPPEKPTATDGAAAGGSDTTTVVATTSGPSSTSEGRGLRIGGIATASAGVLVLAGGFVANLKHNSMIDDLQGGYEPGKHDTAKTYRSLAIAGYAVGGACLAGGALLYYLGWRAGKVSVAPAVLAGGAAAVMTGAF